MEIQGPTELEHFRECHIVEGSLSIRIGFNMTDVYQQLEENLGNIEEINGALKIYRYAFMLKHGFMIYVFAIKIIA